MTIENPIDQAGKRIELDREQWSDLDRVNFLIHVEGRGEAEAGPFYFGRAFDDPPFFTFSAAADNSNPGTVAQMTVGVSEWIQDDNNMYVGAKLWFVFDACWEPFPTGVVYTENFDNLLARQGGGGPKGNEIMGRAVRGLGWPSANDFSGGVGAPALINPTRVWSEHFVDQDGQGRVRVLNGGEVAPFTTTTTLRRVPQGDEHLRSSWFISSENPASGTYHARQTHPAFQVEPTSSNPSDLVALTVGLVVPCFLEDNRTGYDWSQDFTPPLEFPFDDKAILTQPMFPVRPGMVVDIEVESMLNVIDDQIDQQFRPEVSLYDESMSHIGQAFGDTQPDNFPALSYKKFTEHHEMEKFGGYPNENFETNWPPDPPLLSRLRYFSVGFIQGWNPIGPPDIFAAKVLDVDNIKITVTGEAQSFVKPSFQANLSFQGPVLKSYAHVHPLRSYERPASVVLK